MYRVLTSSVNFGGRIVLSCVFWLRKMHIYLTVWFYTDPTRIAFCFLDFI